jgi:hypothetical protein
MIDETQKPCSAPEAGQFDFWLGEWDLTWKDGGGRTLRGTNTITKEYGGCVIYERFDGAPGMDLKGMSVSTYNPAMGKWQQTWVDDQGNYFDLVGGFADGKMTLMHEREVDGRLVQLRMVFFNIGEIELDWQWERSEDGGENWNVLWRIHYRRKK